MNFKRPLYDMADWHFVAAVRIGGFNKRREHKVNGIEEIESTGVDFATGELLGLDERARVVEEAEGIL